MSPFTLIGIGMLLIGLDLRMGGLDLLPDIAGYGLTLIALQRLRRAHPAFDSAGLLVLFFIFWDAGAALLAFFGNPLRGLMPAPVVPIDSMFGNPAPRISTYGNQLAVIFLLPEVLYCWCLCAGVAGLAAQAGRDDFAAWAGWLKGFQAVAAAGLAILGAGVLARPSIVADLFPLLMALGALRPLLVGLLMLQAAAELRGRPGLSAGRAEP